MTIRLVAFDLDDTLAPSKSRVDPEMAELLNELIGRVPVCIISGGRFEQFSMQVLDALDPAAGLQNLHLMPTCGTQYYEWSGSSWTKVYSEDLTEAQKTAVTDALTAGEAALGFDDETWGPKIEDRGSQITFSALGQQAPVDAKKAWDPTGSKKEALRKFVAERVPELEVRGGGSTSVDVTRKGVDKAYGMEKIKAKLGLDDDDILFVGDRLDEGGNDYPVKAMGIPCVAVQEWEQTAIFVRGLIATFDLQATAAAVGVAAEGL
jgi:phosphomannomutase